MSSVHSLTYFRIQPCFLAPAMNVCERQAVFLFVSTWNEMFVVFYLPRQLCFKSELIGTSLFSYAVFKATEQVDGYTKINTNTKDREQKWAASLSQLLSCKGSSLSIGEKLLINKSSTFWNMPNLFFVYGILLEDLSARYFVCFAVSFPPAQQTQNTSTWLRRSRCLMKIHRL